MVELAVFLPQQYRFRFYEDGAESTSTPKANEDVDIDLLTETDQNLGLRVMMREIGGGTSAADWQLQYSYNGGAYTNVDNASSVVKSYPSASLTNGANTSNRGTNGITDPPAGSFNAGEVEDANGLIENNTLAAYDFNEELWSLTVIAADTGHNSTIDFRVLYNVGAGDNISSILVTPTITTKKTQTRKVLVIS